MKVITSHDSLKTTKPDIGAGD